MEEGVEGTATAAPVSGLVDAHTEQHRTYGLAPGRSTLIGEHDLMNLDRLVCR